MNRNLGNTYKGKIIKKKRKLIEKSKVKNRYYKTIQNEEDDTPDYIKEIFATDKKEEKEKNEKERIKEENLEKKKEYYRNRKSTRHKLARKNSRGQPIMKNQLEYLLSKLEK
ncbi:hypothetical protein LY90DRAFT_704158 [Neocallimastix californiae]|uniref:rRNA-processing protein FYV7 n=1 Tax=Neocallimastix californiae TaxID=1754190 RepID=A0A1Y2C0B9_9FUNG|nr:hypothetical protein LY90DRAFT_704158 [Neocallimastix californiae]|eukprot:ORY40327.1 hypothetical protein LY90DRAFT_704158 [Neocallimastix californiae]